MPSQKLHRTSKGHHKEGTPLLDPFKVHTSAKFAMEEHHHLIGVIKQRKELKGEEYIRSDFYPTIPKVMTTSIRKSTGEKYLAQALETQNPPKWFRVLALSEYQVFFDLQEYLEKASKAEPCIIKEILDRLDVDLTLEEVEVAVQTCRENGFGKIDFCQILFELCNANGYFQRMKRDKILYKAQMIGQFTKRQVLFYSISTVATFPHFAKDPIYYCLKNRFRPHRIKYYMPSQRVQGLSTRQAFRKAKVLETIAAHWRDTYSCAYNDDLSEPQEPSLVRQQRWIKEGRKEGRVSDMSSFVSSESSEEVEKIPIQRRIEMLALRAYNKLAQPIQKFPPHDWNRHTTELAMLPLPVTRFPSEQLALMRKYHVSVSDLPNILPKLRQCLHSYYNRLKEVLMEQSLRHWISTYADYYKNTSMSDDYALMFRNYSALYKEDTYVENPWFKPSFWLTKTKVSRKLAFE